MIGGAGTGRRTATRRGSMTASTDRDGRNERGHRRFPASPPWGDADPVGPPPEIAARWGVRTLDPVSAGRFPGEQLRATAYHSDRLLVPWSWYSDGERRRRLEEVVGEAGFDLVPDDRDTKYARYLSEAQVADLPVQFRLVPRDQGPQAPADAWNVLQRVRAALGRDKGGPALDHLMAADRPPSMVHSVVEDGNGVISGGSGYAPSGRTRMPVALPVAPLLPRRSDRDVRDRRPVVAVLDTGCGRHDWFPDDVVDRDVRLDGERIGRPEGEPDPEMFGDVLGPLDGALDWVAGHGTFIAGVVRQLCPDADILAIPVIHADGVVPESELNAALAQLLVLAVRHARGEAGGRPVDVVSLSIGYYHEATDPASNAALGGIVRAFGKLGIPVVTAAGNEATIRPTVPAVFSPHGTVAPEADVVPVVSVGALNPDGSVALFSNSGDWITAWAPGALLVSALPTTFRTAARSATAFERPLPGDGAPDALPRSTVDPDDFRGGYGIWSGTSFAAPYVAGAIAQRLTQAVELGLPPLTDVSGGVARGWDAVTHVTGLKP
jgi:subtilisin family serine protease